MWWGCSLHEADPSFQFHREAFVAFECLLGLFHWCSSRQNYRHSRHLGSLTSRHSLQDVFIFLQPLFSEYIPSYSQASNLKTDWDLCALATVTCHRGGGSSNLSHFSARKMRARRGQRAHRNCLPNKLGCFVEARCIDYIYIRACR